MLFQQSEGTAAQRRWLFACVDATDGVTEATFLWMEYYTGSNANITAAQVANFFTQRGF